MWAGERVALTRGPKLAGARGPTWASTEVYTYLVCLVSTVAVFVQGCPPETHHQAKSPRWAKAMGGSG